MFTRLIYTALLLWQVCRGFDFTFRAAAPTSPRGKVSSFTVCGVLRCTENLVSDPLDKATPSRKIASMTIHSRSSGDNEVNEQWEQLAALTPGSTENSKVSAGRRLSGQLLDTQGNIQLELMKGDCMSTEFSCVATLVDNDGQTTVMRSVISGKINSDTDQEFDPKDSEVAKSQRTAIDDSDQAGGSLRSEQLVTSLLEKLKCIETRLEEFTREEDSVKDSIRNLKDFVSDKLNGFEGVVRDKVESSQNRIDDRMDRLENRLEDKLLGLSSDKPPERTKNECAAKVCNKVTSQLEEIIESGYSITENLTDFKNHLLRAEATASQSAKVSNELDNKLSSLVPLVETFKNSYAGGALLPVEEFHDALGVGRKEWRLVFRGTANNNVDVYPAYLYGTGIPLQVEVGCKQFNTSLPCVNHYRNHQALDNWESIDKVLLAIYVKDQIVKQVIFNGEDSSYTSWFESGRVVLSSWDDLTTLSHNRFSIIGETNPLALRRFYMNHIYSGCPGDKGWFFVGESIPGVCQFENKLVRPTFQYAKGRTVAVWQSSETTYADAIGVYLKYK